MKRLLLTLAACLLALPALAQSGGGGGGGGSGGPGMFTNASNATLPTAIENLSLLDGTASYYTLAQSSLYPTYATQSTTTANTTNGSSVITVANATGILAGDVVSAGSFLPAATICWASTVVGTTVTLTSITGTCNATGTLTGTSVTFGTNRFLQGQTTFTNTLGSKYGLFGAAAVGHSVWDAQYWNGADFNVNTVHSVSPFGFPAGLFASRTSDNTSAGGNVITEGCLFLDDNSLQAHGGLCHYDQSILNSFATGSGHIQTESSILNQAYTAGTLDPYTDNAAAQVVNHRLDCGIGSGTPLPCSSPFQVINNGSTYKSGIIFGNGSLSTSGGLASAFQLPQNYAIDWFYSAGNKSWRLYSSATGAAPTINMGNSGLITISGATPNLTFFDTGGFSRALNIGVTDGFSGYVNATGGGNLNLQNGGTTEMQISSLGSGVLGTTKLFFGGYTSSFPMLKQGSGAVLLLRDSADSGYAQLRVNDLYDSDAAPTGTAGSGYVRATSPTITTPTFSGTVTATLVTGLNAPTNGGDAVNKTYADAIASGIVTHASAAAATTANLTATASGTGVGKTLTNSGAQAAFSVDGYSASVNDRILVKNQTTQKDNGIYTVTTVGTGSTNWVLTRATDFDQASAAEVAVGASIIVINGTVGAKTQWVETGQGPFTVDTTAIVFSQTVSASNGSVNSGTQNQLGYYASNGTAISGLATANNGVLVTSAGGVPSISSTLPNGLALGTATATTINGNTLSSGTWTLTGAAAKTLTFNNSITLAGTDATVMTFPTTSKTIMASDYSNGASLGAANAFLTSNGTGIPNAVALTGIVKGNGASAPTAVTAPAGTIVGTTDTQALTNKTLTDQIDQEAHISTGNFSLTASTSLTSITGLSQALTAAGKYSCHGHVHFTTAPTTSNGLKVALATSDTLTVTTLNFTVMGFNGAAFMTSGVGSATALAANAIASTNAVTDLILNAEINVNVAGTLQVQMAENVASGTIASTAGNARWECHRAS